MSVLQRESAVGHDELAVLKLLALEGGLEGDVKISCSHLAERLDASNQTASRRLQRLESADLLERDTVSDGQWVAITETGERALHAEYEDYRRIFETDSQIGLEGTVTSGMGEGRHYISLSGYQRQFEERLGYEPFPGTLNVDLREDSVRRRSAMASLEPVPIDGWESDERTYGPAVCYPRRSRLPTARPTRTPTPSPPNAPTTTTTNSRSLPRKTPGGTLPRGRRSRHRLRGDRE